MNDAVSELIFPADATHVPALWVGHVPTKARDFVGTMPALSGFANTIMTLYHHPGQQIRHIRLWLQRERTP
jgi:hypothetical protein